MGRKIKIGQGHTNVAMPGRGAPVLHEGDTYTVSDADYALMQAASITGTAATAMIVDLGTAPDPGAAGIAAETDPVAEASLTTHLANPTDAHDASAVSVNPSGLVVITTSNVQAALAQLDSWANGRPTNESGLLSALPANGTRPNNSTYFATDQFGGTAYRMVNGAWAQQSAGVTQAGGQIIAGPAQFSSTMDLKAIGATVTDVPGMSLAVPASARPVLLKAYFNIVVATGTAAAGATVRPALAITDVNNNILGIGIITIPQITAASAPGQYELNPEAYLPAPVAGGTYKLRAYIVSAAPAGWTSVNLSSGYTGTGINNFYAVAA